MLPVDTICRTTAWSRWRDDGGVQYRPSATVGLNFLDFLDMTYMTSTSDRAADYQRHQSGTGAALL